MICQFAWANVFSFKEQATLNLVAASQIHNDTELDKGNVFRARERPQLDLLRVAAIYGANASGKSNVWRALGVFQRCVLESANVGFSLNLLPFYLDTVSASKPSYFEIIFVQNETRGDVACEIQYRYGFEIQTRDGQTVIHAEWLYEAESTTEATLFEREGSSVRLGRRFKEGKVLLKDKQLSRTDALFLSLTAQLGTPHASALVSSLRANIRMIGGIDDDALLAFTANCLEKDKHCDAIQTLMREADTGIPRVVLEDVDDTDQDVVFPDGVSEEEQEQLRRSIRNRVRARTRLMAEHPVYDENGNQVDTVRFPLTLLESQGTQKLFAYAGPILDALANGRCLVIDEMDARFHPLLTRALIRLFQSPETNPKNAQLVFITHDTNLLDSKNLRRDQILFVEKDRFGASHLYALSDFKGVRKGASFEDQYIQGRYGGIPFLGGLSKAFADAQGEAVAIS